MVIVRKSLPESAYYTPYHMDENIEKKNSGHFYQIILTDLTLCIICALQSMLLKRQSPIINTMLLLFTVIKTDTSKYLLKNCYIT